MPIAEGIIGIFSISTCISCNFYFTKIKKNSFKLPLCARKSLSLHHNINLSE